MPERKCNIDAVMRCLETLPPTGEGKGGYETIRSQLCLKKLWDEMASVHLDLIQGLSEKVHVGNNLDKKGGVRINVSTPEGSPIFYEGRGTSLNLTVSYVVEQPFGLNAEPDKPLFEPGDTGLTYALGVVLGGRGRDFVPLSALRMTVSPVEALQPFVYVDEGSSWDQVITNLEVPGESGVVQRVDDLDVFAAVVSKHRALLDDIAAGEPIRLEEPKS